MFRLVQILISILGIFRIVIIILIIHTASFFLLYIYFCFLFYTDIIASLCDKIVFIVLTNFVFIQNASNKRKTDRQV